MFLGACSDKTEQENCVTVFSVKFLVWSKELNKHAGQKAAANDVKTHYSHGLFLECEIFMKYHIMYFFSV